MKDSHSQTLAMFHAYLDDQLSPAARAQFEKLSEKNASIQKQLSQQLNIRQQIRARYLETPLDSNALGRLEKYISHYGEGSASASASSPATSAPATGIARSGALKSSNVDLDTAVAKATPPANTEFSAPKVTHEIILEDRDTNNWHVKVEKFANNRLDELSNTLQTLKSTPQRLMLDQFKSPNWAKPALIVLGVVLLLAIVIFFSSGHDKENVGGNDNSVLSAIELLALDAHRIYAGEADHAVEIGADEQDKLLEWFSDRLQSPVKPANFGAMGFELMGGRLLPSMRKHAAMFMYHDEQDHRVSLIIRKFSSNDSATLCQELGDLNLCRWQDSTFVYFLISDLGLNQIKPLARAAERISVKKPR